MQRVRGLNTSGRCDTIWAEVAVDTGTIRHNGGSQVAGVLGWLPSSEEERAAVLEQLERLLSSSCFRNSRKYPAFLRYVVEHTVNGQAEHLKERTLGVEVFGRQPDYDTAIDPVVRIVAAEVRKRIGQYYHELAAPGEVLIDLPSGTYVPKLAIPQQTATPPLVGEHAALEPVSTPERIVELPQVTEAVLRPRAWRVGLRAWHVVAALSLALLAVAAVRLTLFRTTGMDQFWGPVLDSPNRLLIVTGGGASWMSQPSASTVGAPASLASLSVAEQQSRDVVAFSDATTLAAVGGIFRSQRKAYLIRPSSVIDLPQLRTGPAVLIGALNNPWTLRLTANLRFNFMRDDAAHSNWILDRKNPGMRDWKIDTASPFALVTEDWAVISRFRHPDTEHWIVTAPGLSRWGTIAAGEFLTDPVHLEGLAKLAPEGWRSRNLQAVIATKVINGQPGPPRIVAAEFW